MNGRAWYGGGLAALVACGGSTDRERPAAPGGASDLPSDSLVLTSAAGAEIWFTLARVATAANGRRCVERGLEIRQGGKGVQVPLLYTGSPPVLLDDSTMRAILWTHCTPGPPYRVSLRTGHPVRERAGAAP